MDLFRTDHRPLTDHEKALVMELKTLANEMNGILEQVTALHGAQKVGREIALSRTNLQQAVFWGAHAISAS